MNCASLDTVANLLEKSVFTWNDLVSAAKSSKEFIPNHFLQIFSFLKIFRIGQTFTSYERRYCPNWLKWTVPLRKGWKFLREKCLYLKRSGIGCKKFQRVQFEPFLINFKFFADIYYRSNIYFLWANLLSKLAQMTCASLERVINFLDKSVFTWDDLVSRSKSSKECTLNYFWQIFSFFRIFLRI